MTAFKIIFPHKLFTGANCWQNLPEDLLALQLKRVAILTIEPLLDKALHLKQALEQQGLQVLIDHSVVQEPYFSDFEKVKNAWESFHPQAVVGLGGGSVLDVAKLLAALIGAPQQLSEVVGNGLLKGRNIKLFCAPATSGTGSEVSPNAILVDDADGQKKGIISPYLVPDYVYVDPLLTLTVPPAITAATGLDALTHCLEAYTNKFAQPFIDLFAYEGMKLIAENIATAVNDGGNIEAREKVSIGSLYGGFCLGPVNTAAVHALAYPLGSMFHLAHGLSNAVMLPYVMEYNISATPQRYAKVAEALGCKVEADELAMATAGVQKIKELVAACGIPTRLRDLGIPESSFDTMATEALKIQRLLKNNPREVNWEDARNIYQKAY